MAIVNLKSRVTADWDARCDNLKSPESLIYVSNSEGQTANPASMEIQVGTVYIVPGDNISYTVPEEGLIVRPRTSVVVYSLQQVALPYNVFGVVTGKGNYIFQGCFVSSGKIDPGFKGNLKIGFYNGGNKNICLKSGDGFASMFFINTEFTMPHELKEYQMSPPADAKKLGFYRKSINFIKRNYISFIGWVIALPAMLYYLVNIFKAIKGL